MLVVGTALVLFAALLHVLFFVGESLTWTRPRVWKRFGVASQEHAEVLKPMAYNQGFYNLFLALGAVTGIILYFAGNRVAGVTLVSFTMGCMVLAAMVLSGGGRRYLVPALVQGLPALLGLIFFVTA